MCARSYVFVRNILKEVKRLSSITCNSDSPRLKKRRGALFKNRTRRPIETKSNNTIIDTSRRSNVISDSNTGRTISKLAIGRKDRVLYNSKQNVRRGRITNDNRQDSRAVRRADRLDLNTLPRILGVNGHQAASGHVNRHAILRPNFRHVRLVRITTRHNLHGHSTFIR